jgi:transglutaminase-like putative cysteine protease
VNDTTQPQIIAPEVLIVAANLEEQRRATAMLVRPAEVAPIAARLARCVGPRCAEAEAIAGWLRQLHFINDPPGLDVWRGPLATLSLGGGDCEDFSLLALSLLLALGGQGIMMSGILLSSHGPIGHAWTEGFDRAGWFQLDGTNGFVGRFQRSPAYIPYAAFPPGLG